jgi:hypothetical protein
MKIVTFTTPMRPHSVGDTRIVPDDVADKLVADGVAGNPQHFPPGSAPAPATATVPTPRRRGYLTKAGAALRSTAASAPAASQTLPL